MTTARDTLLEALSGLLPYEAGDDKGPAVTLYMRSGAQVAGELVSIVTARRGGNTVAVAVYLHQSNPGRRVLLALDEIIGLSWSSGHR